MLCKNKSCKKGNFDKRAKFEPERIGQVCCCNICEIEYIKAKQYKTFSEKKVRLSNAKNKHTYIAKVSKKRQSENKIYLELRKEFLKDKICPITKEIATEVHHQKGRIGKLFLDTRYWLAVSHEGHVKIESNPNWAIDNGYSLKRLDK